MSAAWPPARVDALAEMLAHRKTSTQVAFLLGVSRNTVLGKITRMRDAGDPRFAPARPSAPRKPRRWTTPDADRLAEVMADGCPSLLGAAIRLGKPTYVVEELWRRICDQLGSQAA